MSPAVASTVRTLRLYPHQIANTKFLRDSVVRCGSGLDASDPGTGKSFTALAVAATLGKPVQVICPLGVGSSWANKGAQCGVPVTWINYEKARRPGWSPVKDALVVFDEVHRCKSPSSQTSELLMRVSLTHKTLMLSATPFESPLDTRAMLHALRVTPWSSWYSELPKFDCYRAKFRNNAWTWRGSPTSVETLRSLLRDSMCKTRWQEVEGYPELRITADVVDVVDLKGVREALATIAGSDIKDITKTLKQRMFVECAKVDAMSDIATDLMQQGRSVVAFFNFTESLRAWADLMGASIIDGSVTGADRTKVMQAFQLSKTPTALAVNIRAGGEGIDLHDMVGVPRVALHCPSWSARDFRQCVGRTHRVGTKSVAQHRIMFAADTIEELVRSRMLSKLENIDAITDADLHVTK